ncbi:MAG TPA: hypothetical protein VGR51_05990 [Thermoplasmata archaeon]|nr:hypothetical protein [Thermoplasmata archaeon]
MPDTEKIDQRIKRLHAIETAYRGVIKHAQATLRDHPEQKKKHERTIAKHEKKIEKLLPKIRHMRELRAAIRAR